MPKNNDDKRFKKTIYTKTILFLYWLFGANCFLIFLLAMEIKADECIANGKFIEKCYKKIQNDFDFIWIIS